MPHRRVHMSRRQTAVLCMICVVLFVPGCGTPRAEEAARDSTPENATQPMPAVVASAAGELFLAVGRAVPERGSETYILYRFAIGSGVTKVCEIEGHVAGLAVAGRPATLIVLKQDRETLEAATISADGKEQTVYRTRGMVAVDTATGQPDQLRVAFAEVKRNDARYKHVVIGSANRAGRWRFGDAGETNCQTLSWTPQGKLLIFEVYGDDLEHTSIWTLTLDGTAATTVKIPAAVSGTAACWSPERDRLLIRGGGGGRMRQFQQAISLLDLSTLAITDLAVLPLEKAGYLLGFSSSLDGKRVAYVVEQASGVRSIRIVNVDGRQTRTLVTGGQYWYLAFVGQDTLAFLEDMPAELALWTIRLDGQKKTKVWSVPQQQPEGTQ